MIDRELLKEIGFVLIVTEPKGKEKWVYYTTPIDRYTVTYGEWDIMETGMCNGDTATLPELINEIISSINLNWESKMAEALAGEDW